MKAIAFKYEKDGASMLGVPEKVHADKGNPRDGGCELFFNTSPLSVGIDEKFSLYLYAEDINVVSRAVWEAYYRTEPERAKADFERLAAWFRQTVKEGGG